MVVILHHAADRDLKPQLLQHLKGYVDLSPSAVHHQQIREFREASQLLRHLLFLKLAALLQAVAEPPCEHLVHAGVVVRPLDRTDPELPVIAPLRLSMLIDHHGAHRLEAVRIGDVEGLHTADIRKAQKSGDLLHSSDGPALLPLDPFLILA